MTDVLFENTGELIGASESTREHQQDILIFQKGWHKFNPSIGVGILDYIGDEISSESLKNSITNEFRRDGMKVNQIVIDQSEKIYIDANY